jgi:hypothetical protein
MSFDLKIKNGDLVINRGDFQTIVDSEKLIQDILKIALTTAGSNPRHPWYGSYVSRSLIGSGLSTDIIFQYGQTQLQNALEILKSLQDAQVKQFQRVSPDEQINSILDISINRNTRDPRLFDVIIKVVSKGFKPVTTVFRVSTI